MHSVLSFAIAVSLSGFSPAYAKTDAPISLPKTSKWEMRYDEDSCNLVAVFGQDQSKVVLVISRERPDDSFGIQLYGKALSDSSGGHVPMEMTFGTAPPLKRAGLAMIMSSGERLPVIKIDGLRLDGIEGRDAQEKAPKIAPASEAAVTSIGFAKDNDRRYILETGSMEEPFAAMRACTNDLLKYWGFDPAVETSLTRRPVPTGNPGSWATDNDYPHAALGNSGLVQFRLDVGTDGVPYGCRILYRTNPDQFADLSCQLLMRRARFKPALDANGKPVKSFYINRILWVSGG